MIIEQARRLRVAHDRAGDVVSRLRVYVSGFRGFEADARRFLVASLVAGAAMSLYWIDFNLYLEALGHDPATIGIVAMVSSIAAALAAFPAGSLSDRVGRRLVLLGSSAVMAVAIGGLMLGGPLELLFLFGAVYAVGQQAIGVVTVPYMTEHSRPGQRAELFSLQFATQQATAVGAGLLGGIVASVAQDAAGHTGPDVFRAVLVLQLILTVASALVFARLGPDRPATVTRPPGPRRWRPRPPAISDPVRFARLLIPGLLIAVGAGQIIPFLNLYIGGRFGLDLAAINWVFALTSLGTLVAILLQPALAHRYGMVASVVIVQSASIPFLVVLGFSPVLWTVILAMAVRNSLMNAGNPIQNAFAMGQVPPAERATLAAAMSVLWSIGWVIGGPYYSVLQASLGFDVGYAVGFISIIVLYSVATALYWIWFHDADRRAGAADAALEAVERTVGGTQPASG